MTTQARELFRFRNAPTLFLTVTNKCNLNCTDCYSKYKDNKDEVADLSSMVDAITEIAPGKLVVTGGEPLLYPNRVLGMINYFRTDYRQHWDITLCSNLCFKELSKEQLDVIRHCDYIQTSYSIDRFENNDLFDYFKKNITTIKNLENSSIKKVDLIVTLTRKQVEDCTVDNLVDTIESLDIDGVSFEQFTFITEDPLFNVQQFYRISDEYMLSCCRLIKNKELLNFNNWKIAMNNNILLHCNLCDSGYCKVFNVDAGSVKDGCTCCITSKTSRKDRLYKFTHHCIECEYYKYCGMDCERFGKNCAFPKKTFQYFLDNIKENI